MIKRIGFIVAFCILLCACSARDQSTTGNSGTIYESSTTNNSIVTNESSTTNDSSSNNDSGTTYESSTTIDFDTTSESGTTNDSSNTGDTSIENAIKKTSYELDEKSFIDLRQAALKADLKSDRKIDDVDAPYHITGSYDIDLDGKLDNIKLTLCRDVNYENSIIQINDLSFEMMFENPGIAYLVDLDITDSSIELAISDSGRSDDPYYVLFRYTGTEIIKLGTVRTAALINGHGSIISTWEMVNFQPKIVFGIHRIQDNKLFYEDIDFSEALNKEYTLAADTYAYFAEVDEITPELFVGKEPTLFKKGQKLIIKKIDIIINHPTWYYVVMQDGRKGILLIQEGD